MIDENKNNYISYWLLLITLLVGLMIVVGGLTRLTDSGLSITEWELFSGILPPITPNDWEEYFTLYKKIPEYKLLNLTMSLNEFKIIFWWEYSHRLLGRIIGIVYILPLFYFSLKKKIRKDSLISLYLILFLIIIQGFIGWYMVQSGLVDRVDVSHYRLMTHLFLAFFIFILLLWNYLKYSNKYITASYHQSFFYLIIVFLFFLLIQICLGALVSGLDAGQIYQSWPLMNNNYFPDDSNITDLFSLKAFETPSIVQFLHRNIAYIILLLFIFIFVSINIKEKFLPLKKAASLVFFFLVLQILLGILTILSGAHILLASIHQFGSILLIAFTLILAFKTLRIN